MRAIRGVKTSVMNWAAMRTLLTLDYELFFGRRPGTVARSMLEPTEALARVAARRGAKLVFFVDAGFLVRLRAEMSRAEALRREHAQVCRQLESLARAGHEIQLHIHPHWEDSHWAGDGWRLDVRRFALQAFAPAQVADIVGRYAGELRAIAGAQAAYAYRAGGWVVQPFAPIRAALLDNGITIDSSVFAGGFRPGIVQPFDFRDAPAKSRWRFDADPLVEAPRGPFLEVPIASRRLRPDFFWRLAWARKAGGPRHRPYGDGCALPMEGGDLLGKLLRPSVSVVSLDGYKASFLAAAAREQRARGFDDFVVIGHPKALTRYSLEVLDALLAARGAERIETCTFAPYRSHGASRPLESLAA